MASPPRCARIGQPQLLNKVNAKDGLTMVKCLLSCRRSPGSFSTHAKFLHKA